MTVVLLHAGVCDHRMWDRITPAIREAGRSPVVAPDLRGFGSRPAGVSSFSHAGDVVALLDGLGADRADIVGASFGGRVALQVAALVPDRVASLALLAPALPVWEYTDPGLLAFAEQEEAAIDRGDVDAAVDANVRFWADRLSAGDQAYVAEAQRRAFEHGGEEADGEEAIQLDRIAAKTLVMVGDQDVSDFVDIARFLADSIPANPELRVVEGAGHLLALERPDLTSEVLAAWLREE